jgi:HEAT repeat protein
MESNATLVQGRARMGWRLWACGAVGLLVTCAGAQPAAGAPQSSPAWPILEELGKKLEDQSLPLQDRLDIILTFEEWTGPQVRPPLVAVLKDPLPAIRAMAARALGWPGNVEAVPALRERVETPGEIAVVRAAAVGSLGRIGDRSVRPLVVAATQAPEASIRQVALWGVALGPLVDPVDRTSYLVRLAEDRTADAQLRVDAVNALAGVKEAGVVTVLARILETEPPVTIILPPGTPTTEQIMPLRRAQALDVAGYAAGALGELEARTELPLLLKSAEVPNDFFLRLMSLRSLVAWKVPEAFPVLVRRLEDPLPEIRFLALTGLASLGDQRAVDPVQARLSDAVPEVRARAVQALAWLGGPQVRPQLEALQQRESNSSVLSALEAALAHLAR